MTRRPWIPGRAYIGGDLARQRRYRRFWPWLIATILRRIKSAL